MVVSGAISIAVILSLIFLRESLDLTKIAGIGLVLAGIFFLSR